MLSYPFKINANDYTQYAYYLGVSVKYDKIVGIQDAYTMDGTLHDDVIGKKATYTIPMNPFNDETALYNLLNDYNNEHVFLTIYDKLVGQVVTKLCKTGPAGYVDDMFQHGSVMLWTVPSLVFTEM